MKKLCCVALTAFSAVFSLFLAQSCVNEKYEISEDTLDLEVSVFQDGVSIPLGSTDSIKLKSLLSELDPETLQYFQLGEDGAYGIGLSDSYDLSDSLKALTEMLVIPAFEFSESIEFKLEDVDVSDIRMDATAYKGEFDLSSVFEVPDMDINFDMDPLEIKAGINKFIPSSSELDLDLDDLSLSHVFMSAKGIDDIPSVLVNDTPMAIDDLGYDFGIVEDFDLADEPLSVPVHIELPEGISSVKEISLSDNAAIKVMVAMENPFIVSGEIVPHVDIDLSDIFHLTDAANSGHTSEEIDHIIKDFTLSDANGWAAEGTYGIESIAVSESDWTVEDGHLVLDRDVKVAPKGSLTYKDLTTTTRKIAERTSDDLKVNVRLEFIDFTIDDVHMEIDPMSIEESQDVPVQVPAIKLPDLVSSVGDVTFAEGSGITLSISARNLKDIEGLDLVLDELALTFPEELVVEGADAANRLVLEGGDIADGIERKVVISGVDMPAPVDGQLSIDGVIKVEAKATASGSIHSAQLPSSADKDIALVADVESDLEIADYSAEITGYDYELDPADEQYSYEIKVEIPEAVKDMGTITIYPEGEPEVVLEIEIPETGLELVPLTGKGLTVHLPEVLKFKNLPSEYDAASHALIYKDRIPESLSLVVDKLVVTPELDAADGKYYAKGRISVEGGVSVAPGTVTKKDIETLASGDAAISFHVDVPELKPSVFNLDSYETSINEEFAFDLLSGDNELSDIIASIGVVELDDVYLSMTVDASSLPETGDADLTIAFDVALPKMVNVDPAYVENGVLKVEGSLDKDGKINVDPIKIISLDLSGVDFAEGIQDKILINGAVKLADASLSVDEWLGKNFNVDVEVGIGNSATGEIEIASVEANVDYQIDPVTAKIDLSGISTSLGTDNLDVQLDINRFSLRLEVLTNLGVPVNADIVMEPYYNGAVDESKAIIIDDLALNCSQSSETVAATRLWLSNTEKDCPSDYEFIEADLVSLVRDMPDSICFKVSGGTDADTKCVFEPSADYVLKINYAADLPLEFGEAMNITFRDTIPDLGDYLQPLLEAGSLGLKGDFVNGLPIGLELTLNVLDEDGRVLELSEEAGHQTISPCGLDGTPVTTSFDILLQKKAGADMSKASAVEIIFNASSKDAAGVPLTDESFLLVKLQAMIPDGITVDLKEIMKEDEVNE